MSNAQRRPGPALSAAEARRLLSVTGADLAPGLSAAELARAEDAYGIRFADDHRELLTAGLPVGDGWPDWRDPDSDAVRRSLTEPVDGVLFDVEHNVFWDRTWGDRPDALADALAVARDHVAREPRLVPVHGHRYLAGIPGTSGLPVLSVVQTDVIVYGRDLADYVAREFGPDGYGTGPEGVTVDAVAPLGFWGRLVEV